MTVSAYIINEIEPKISLDQQALITALKTGIIAGAALDVFDGEPEVPAELMSIENVVLTPHIASITHPPTACRYIADAIYSYRSERTWPNLVELGSGY